MRTAHWLTFIKMCRPLHTVLITKHHQSCKSAKRVRIKVAYSTQLFENRAARKWLPEFDTNEILHSPWCIQKIFTTIENTNEREKENEREGERESKITVDGCRMERLLYCRGKCSVEAITSTPVWSFLISQKLITLRYLHKFLWFLKLPLRTWFITKALVHRRSVVSFVFID